MPNLQLAHHLSLLQPPPQQLLQPQLQRGLMLKETLHLKETITQIFLKTWFFWVAMD